MTRGVKRGASNRGGVKHAGAVLVLLLVVFGTAPAWGQDRQLLRPEPPPPSVLDLTFSGGVLTPLADLTSDPESFGTTVTTAAAVSVGVAWWHAPRWGVGLEATYAPADLRIRPTDFQGVIPEDLGSADWWSATVNVIHRLPLQGAASVAEPFFAVGAGLRHLSVDEIAGPEVESATDPVGTVAAGVGLRLDRSLSIRMEIRNRVSGYTSPRNGEARLQNDLTVGVGLGVQLR